MSSKEHWDAVYRTKPADGVSWFRPHLERSLAFLEAAKVGLDARVIDVGGGASTFVDDLLERGYTQCHGARSVAGGSGCGARPPG